MTADDTRASITAAGRSARTPATMTRGHGREARAHPPPRPRDSTGRVVVLTGAGISAESGIPTFRGEEGYWVVGSRNYMPQEMATHEMFERAPEEVWRWYLYRFGVCKDARPNAGHAALVAARARARRPLHARDPEHRRAAPARRLASASTASTATRRTCAARRTAASAGSTCPPLAPRGSEPLTAAERARAHLPALRRLAAPARALVRRVLRRGELPDGQRAPRGGRGGPPPRRGDERRDQPARCRSASSPSRRGAAMVDVNPEANPFAELAERSPSGFFARGSACERLPEIAAALGAEARPGRRTSAQRDLDRARLAGADPHLGRRRAGRRPSGRRAAAARRAGRRARTARRRSGARRACASRRRRAATRPRA